MKGMISNEPYRDCGFKLINKTWKVLIIISRFVALLDYPLWALNTCFQLPENNKESIFTPLLTSTTIIMLYIKVEHTIQSLALSL